MNKEAIENATKTADRGLEREGDSCEGQRELNEENAG
jgi:hypothetical protein